MGLNILVLIVSLLVYVNSAASYTSIDEQLAEMEKRANNALKNLDKFSDDTIEKAKHDFENMPAPSFGDLGKIDLDLDLEKPSQFENRHRSDFGKLDFGDTHSNFGDKLKADFGKIPPIIIELTENDLKYMAERAEYEAQKNLERIQGNGTAVSNPLFLLIIAAIFATIRFY